MNYVYATVSYQDGRNIKYADSLGIGRTMGEAEKNLKDTLFKYHPETKPYYNDIYDAQSHHQNYDFELEDVFTELCGLYKYPELMQILLDYLPSAITDRLPNVKVVSDAITTPYGHNVLIDLQDRDGNKFTLEVAYGGNPVMHVSIFSKEDNRYVSDTAKGYPPECPDIKKLLDQYYKYLNKESLTNKGGQPMKKFECSMQKKKETLSKKDEKSTTTIETYVGFEELIGYVDAEYELEDVVDVLSKYYTYEGEGDDIVFDEDQAKDDPEFTIKIEGGDERADYYYENIFYVHLPNKEAAEELAYVLGGKLEESYKKSEATKVGRFTIYPKDTSKKQAGIKEYQQRLNEMGFKCNLHNNGDYIHDYVLEIGKIPGATIYVGTINNFQKPTQEYQYEAELYMENDKGIRSNIEYMPFAITDISNGMQRKMYFNRLNNLINKGNDFVNNNKSSEAHKSESTDDEPVRVWFCKHKDDDGDDYDEYAVFVDEYGNGTFSIYAHMGQHSSADPGYIEESQPILKPKESDLYKELTNLVGYNLIVCDTDVAEDIMGLNLQVSDRTRMKEKPEDYDLNIKNYEG